MARVYEKTNVAGAMTHLPRWSVARRLHGHCGQAAKAAVADMNEIAS